MNTALLLAILAVAALQIGDWWTTSTILAQGGVEKNPLIRGLIALVGVNPAFLIKGVLVVGVSGYLGQTTLTAPLLMCAVYVVIVGWNLTQMKR